MNDKQTLRLLFISTFVIGVLGIIAGIAMIGVKSILDIWWQLSGIFAAGMLGLFLLGISSKRTKNAEAFLAIIVGVLVIAWMTFPSLVPDDLSYLRSSFNTNMVIVIGTLTIFLAGIFFTSVRNKLIEKKQAINNHA